MLTYKSMIVVLACCFFYPIMGYGQVEGTYFDDKTDFKGIAAVSSLTELYGHGVSAADYDGDGDIDLYVCTDFGVADRIYQNNGSGFFADVAGDLAIEVTSCSRSALWFDYNADGLLDLVVAGDCYEVDLSSCLSARLFRQNQDHSFTETTEEAGLNFEGLYTEQSPAIGGLAAADFDGDGYLDLLVSIWSGSMAIYLNNQDGTFSFSGPAMGITNAKAKFRWQPMVHDFDGDGWQDVYMNVDYISNEFWLNKEGSEFEEAARKHSINYGNSEMGMTLGDYDNDGDFDIYVTNIVRGEDDNNTNLLYRNDTHHGELEFEQIAKIIGVSDYGWGWGTTFGDFNNDGWLDLASTNGYSVQSGFNSDQSWLWMGTSTGQFEDADLSSNFSDTLNAATLVSFDMDRDGDLDLIQSVKLSQDKVGPPIRIYENLSGASSGHFLVVKPRMEGSNKFAIGATVSVQIDTVTLSRLITAGTSFYGQEPAEAYFGLDRVTNVPEVEVTWPDGSSTVRENISANQIVTITKELDLESPQNFSGLLTTTPDTTVELSWTLPSDYECIIERSTADRSEEINFTITEGQSTFTDTNIAAETSYYYRMRTVEGNERSAWTEYWVLEVETNNDPEPNENPIEFDADKYSVARLWNEVLLEGIRNDYARPTVHARNLFHISAAMYDAWAIYDDAIPYFLNNENLIYPTAFQEIELPEDIISAQQEAISYTAYRLIAHRFAQSPGSEYIRWLADSLMTYLDYDISKTSTNYTDNDPAHLGNYIADLVIGYGLQDGSNEAGAYENLYYEPLNEVCVPELPGSQGCEHPNNWQPLGFELFIDQSNNEIPGEVPDFLSPEWGNVAPFSLTDEEKSTYMKEGDIYHVYHDPGAPALIDESDHEASQDYKWGHSLVAIWSSHLDPSDQTMWDISPKSIGNIQLEDLPTTHAGLQGFYNLYDGGDPSPGYDLNPITGQAYEEQLVPRADYGRVLAEFWADGPDSETPPGHWFTILNYVSDHPQVVKKFKGEGETLGDLEWDIKSYFTLGGTMHDAAISAWSIKGYYDYIRPISAIRYMADQGQSTDQTKANYHEAGIPLMEGYIELVEAGDPLAGTENENVGKIKLYAWRGPDYIDDEATDEAGVDWILAENWWPYQRPTFVTPPFAGYISGHSTYSRAAAAVLSRFTGSEYFPGGMGEFEAPKNEFLVFEEGPSVDVTLQWAKYYDASDQCSLSRIWGGIHPPVDDVPGRLIGQKIGDAAFELAEAFFNIPEPKVITDVSLESKCIIYPNPAKDKIEIVLTGHTGDISVSIYTLTGSIVYQSQVQLKAGKGSFSQDLDHGVYLITLDNQYGEMLMKEKLMVE